MRGDDLFLFSCRDSSAKESLPVSATARHTSDNQNVAYKEIKMNRIELTMSGLKCGQRLDFGEGDNIPDGAQFGRKAAQNNTLTTCHIMCSYIYKIRI